MRSSRTASPSACSRRVRRRCRRSVRAGESARTAMSLQYIARPPYRDGLGTGTARIVGRCGRSENGSPHIITAPRSSRAHSSDRSRGGSWSTNSAATPACSSTHASTSRQAAFAAGVTEYIRAFATGVIASLSAPPGRAGPRARSRRSRCSGTGCRRAPRARAPRRHPGRRSDDVARGHEHPRRAVAALQRVLGRRTPRAARPAPHRRRTPRSCARPRRRRRRRGDAGARRRAVDQHGAGAADAVLAADVASR